MNNINCFGVYLVFMIIYMKLDIYKEKKCSLVLKDKE